MRILRRDTRNDLHAEAEVLAVGPTARAARQTGLRDPDLAFELRVRLPGAAPVDVVHACRVPWDRTPLVGHVLPVTLPGGDPRRLCVDWDAAPSLTDAAMASADAARRGDLAAAASALGFRLRG